MAESILIQFRCAKEFKARVIAAAEVKGLSVSAYIRLALIDLMKKDARK